MFLYSDNKDPGDKIHSKGDGEQAHEGHMNMGNLNKLLL